MKTRWRAVAMIGASVGTALIVVAAWPKKKEPEYQGRKLSEWLRAYELGYSNEEEKRRYDNAREATAHALHAMGTNALPWLVRWIEAEPSAWQEFLRRRGLVMKIPSRRIQMWLVEHERLANHSVQAIKILATKAEPIIPELSRWLRNHHRGRHDAYAVSALCAVGRAAVPTIVRVLEDRTHPGRGEAAISMLELGRKGVDVSAAVPTLLLLDREAAIYLAANPEVCGWPFVPTLFAEGNRNLILSSLRNCLSHSNGAVRVEAALALWSRDGNLPKAMAVLNEAATNASVEVRIAATNAVGVLARRLIETERRQIEQLQ